MLVDIGQQLVFPLEIADPSLRPNLVGLHCRTLPWEDGVKESFEHRHYAELAAQAQYGSWSTKPCESGV